MLTNVCTCGKPLLARYDINAVGNAVSRAEIADRAPTLWRYRELLPVRRQENVVSFGEGMTPVVAAPRLGRAIGVPRLQIKDEGVLPTGTFKARGAAVGVSRAQELGARRFTMPTNGNAGAAWASYGARAGMEALIAMPYGAPRVTRAEVTLAGGQLELVDGLIGDAAKVSASAVDDGWFDAATLREPYRLEGKKTIGLEIVEQFGWSTPDVIVYPTGGGVGLIGIDKAIAELTQLGWMQNSSRPRFVAVQAAGCAPVVEAYERGTSACEPWLDGETIAFGINVGKPLGDYLILDVLRRTGGTAITVEDQAIIDAQQQCYASEGLFVCPEGAAALSAVESLHDSGWISDDEDVLVINTGTGVKYVT